MCRFMRHLLVYIGIAVCCLLLSACPASQPAATPTALAMADFRERCAGSKESLDARPARRITKVAATVVLDDAEPGLTSDNAYAKAAQAYARNIDAFFVQLSSEGIGKWNGCYGTTETLERLPGDKWQWNFYLPNGSWDARALLVPEVK